MKWLLMTAALFMSGHAFAEQKPHTNTDGTRVWSSDPNASETIALTPWEKAVSRCWSIPAGSETVPTVTLIADIDNAGKVTGVRELAPSKTNAERIVADSGAKAIWRCSPYADQPAGELQFRMDAKAMF